MKRLQSMLREIGWLWAIIFVINTALAFVLSPIYIAMYPVLITVCLYFTFMRYDEEGEHK